MTPVTDSDLEALVEERLARLDLAARVRLLQGRTNWRLHAAPQAGLREVVTSDGPAGVRGETWDERDTGANLPAPTALAATWDEALVERLGGLLAAECRRKGVDVLLAPTLNLQRSPLGGRHFECFSEDPLLVGRIGAAFVRGVQAGGVAATAKHYVANDSETARMTVDVRMAPRTLREVYLAPFEQVVAAARPWAVMAAYNRVDGVTLTESPLLADPLSARWGFDGVVVSDWTATRSTEAAANAALDLAMPGPTGPWGDALLAAVRAGRVPAAAVDRKARRILRLAARIGALDGATPRPDVPPPPAPDAPPVRALLREAVAAGVVLLRAQGGVLPLDRTALRRVAVIGPNAAVARVQGGGSAAVAPPYTVSPLDGLRAALPGVEVVHHPGVRTRGTVAPVDGLLGRDPVTGAAGTRVTYLAADGTALHDEHRLSGRIGWGDHGLGHDAATARIETVVTPDVDGRWPVAAGGLGRHVLAVDGVPVWSGEVGVPGGGEPDFEHFVTPPQHAVEVLLTAGRPVRLSLDSDPLRMNDALAVAELCVEPPAPDPVAGIAEAAALAASADVAVVVVGTTAEVESEGFDRASLALPGRQDDLVRAVAAANPRTVVVVNAGAPVLLPWREEVAAVLVSWFGGQEAGHGLADVLLGDAEPGGRLPTTWPAAQEDCPVLSTTPVDGVPDYREGLLVGHRGWAAQVAAGGPAPAYWFGHGLGWTTWAFEGLTVHAGDPGRSDLHVHVQVRNTGARAGRTVAQVYLERPGTDRPPLWLAGFAAVTAGPGGVATADVVVAPRAFAHWDEAADRWDVEPGTFTLTAGASSADRPLTLEVTVTG